MEVKWFNIKLFIDYHVNKVLKCKRVELFKYK